MDLMCRQGAVWGFNILPRHSSVFWVETHQHTDIGWEPQECYVDHSEPGLLLTWWRHQTWWQNTKYKNTNLNNMVTDQSRRVLGSHQCFHQAVKIIEDLTADLKEDAKHKIFYQNAIDFYQLDIIDWVERRVSDFTNCCLIAPIWENVPHDELVPPPHALSNIVEVFLSYHYQETVIAITWFGSPSSLLKEV